MQQAAASGQYGVGSVPQFGGGGSAARTSHAHVLGISHESAAPPTPHHLHQNQNQNQNQQLLQHSAQVGQQQQKKADSLNEIPPPIASRAPLRSAASYENLMPSSSGGGGGGGQFGEEEALAGDEGGDRGSLGSVGNRWPRQETLALLKIRSEMDATFRDASLKGPLWEDVSRKLAELGYHRSAKKCKEKFENVHKYYKRTKDGRAGRQDGKSYRFFSQLEALHSNNNNNNSTSANVNHARNSNNMQAMTSGPGPARLIQPSASAPGPLPPPALLSNNANAIGGEMNRNCGTDANPVAIRHSADFGAGNLSFSSETSDEDDYEEQTDSRKRKRSSGGGAVKKMMLFFEHLMKQVMEKQEMMQQKFLETIEKREQDRMIREEAWKRQEMTRLHREHEIMAQERALSASRDAALISFLHKVTGQTFQVPSMTPHAQSTTSINPVPPVHETYHHHHDDNNNNSNINNNDPDVGAIMNVNTNPAEQMELSFDANSNRWPKTEVHALIKLRSAMEARYQDAGPKGPLWEEISAGMSRLGYNRSSKRCKEKWENINKYFKKVKESNKKRPEDAKTCPYFHQLDQLYRKRIVGRGSSVPGKQEQIDVVACMDNNKNGTQIQGSGTEQILAIMPPLDNNNGVDASNDGATIPTSNGEVHTTFYSRPEDGKGAADQRSLKKVKMKPQNPNFSSFDDGVLVDYFGAGKPFNSNDLKSYVLKPESLVMEDVMDMDDDDMQSAEHHHHHHNHHDQQSMVDDYDDKIEGEDSDNNNENEQQENHHSRHNNNIPTIASGSNSTNGRQSGGVDHLPFAQFVHDNRTGSSVSIAASTAANSSFIAMVHRLAAASEPPDFKSSKA